MYKNVGDGIDVDTANESLVSTMQGFQLQADSAMNVIDAFNEVSNNYAISSAGIGEALKRSAAAFNAANTDLNQSIALITAGNEIVQSPEKVGTMWQTVSARIRGTKAELEELGESADDVLSSSKLQSLVKGYTGVDIMIDKDTYKDIYTIISEIGEKWKDLKDVERAALLEALAGKKQSNTLAAVLNNADRLKEIYETAEGSVGSAQREQDRYTQSLQYSLDQLTAHGEEFWSTFINKDEVKEFIDLLNSLISGATKLVDTFGSIPTVAGILGAYNSIKGGGIFTTIKDEATGAAKGIGILGKSTSELKEIFASIKSKGLFNASLLSDTDVGCIEKYNAAIKNSVPHQQAMEEASVGASEGTKQLKKNANGATISLKGMTLGAKLSTVAMNTLKTAMNAAWWMIIAQVITIVISKFAELGKAQEKAIEQIRSLRDEYNTATKNLSSGISSLNNHTEEFEKLSKGVDDFGKNISLSSDEYDRYQSIVSEILNYTPELIQGYDSEGKAIANKNSLIERSIELMKEEQRLRLKEITSDKNTKMAYEEAKSGWQNTLGYEGANTRNDIAFWFEQNSQSGSFRYAYDVAKIFGLEDQWAEHLGGGKPLQSIIIDNIETVAKNIKDKKAELLALTDPSGNAVFTVDEIDQMIEKSDIWQQQYADWQRDIEDAKHGMDDQFELYAQRAKGYNNLTDAQKVFVNEYIKATGDITDAEGNLLSSDQILEKAKGYEEFVNEFAELKKLSKGGSVDLTFRPEINTAELNKKGWEAGEGFATVFSSAISNTDFEDLTPANIEDTVAINFTPIVVDPNTGEFKGVLSEEELFDYAHDILAGVREDDLNLQIGAKFEGKDAINEAVTDGERIHSLHEKLFINNEAIDSWEELRNVLVKTGDDMVQAGKKANALTVSLSDLENTSDKISKLSSAFKELSDDGYITTKTLGELQKATGLSDDEWAKYETILLNSKKGSADFTRVLSEFTYKILENAFATIDLTNATDEEVLALERKIAVTLKENGVVNASAIAHDWLTKIKAKEKSVSFELGKTVEDTKNKLIYEAKSCGITTAAYAQLVAQEIVFNQNGLDISGKVQKLATLQQALGNTASTAILLNNALGSTNTSGRPDRDFHLALEKYGIKKTLNGLYEYNGVVYKAGMDAVNAAMADEFAKGVNVEIPKVDYSGVLNDKGKSDKSNPIDAIINRIGAPVESLERQGEAIDNQLDMTDAEKEYDKYVELTNKALDNRLKTIEASKTAQNELSKEAQKIHDKYKGVDVESFFFANGEFTEAYHAYLDSLSETKREEFEKDMSNIAKLKKEWFKYYDGIESLEKEVFDLRKDLQEACYDHLSNLINQLERHADLREKQAEDDKEYYDYLINKEQALLDMKRAQFGIENKLAEARREAEKALASSKIGSEYLDEETRKLVYNEDDYKLEIEAIDEISDYVDNLTAKYMSDLNRLGEDEIYRAQEITAEYERRIAIKEKELEIVQAEINLQKKRDTLNNVLAEKNIRQIVDGKWVWTHDTDQLRQATEDLADAKAQVEQLEREKHQLEYTNSLEARIGHWQLEQQAIDQAMEHLRDRIDDFSTKVELLEEPLENFADLINELTAELGGEPVGGSSGYIVAKKPEDSTQNGFKSTTIEDQIKRNSDTWWALKPAADAGDVWAINNQKLLHEENDRLRAQLNGGSSSSGGNGGSNGGAVTKNNSSDVVQQMRNNSTLWHVSDSATQKKLHDENKKLATSIGATYNSTDKKYYKDGKPLYDSGGVLEGLGGIKATADDEIVLPPNITKKILDPKKNILFEKFTDNLGTLFNLDQMPIAQIPFAISQSGLKLPNSTTNRTTSVNYNMNGDVHITESEDANKLLVALINKIKSMPIPD